MRRSSQNSQCSSLRKPTGRWCTAPCSRFQGVDIEPLPSGSFAEKIAASRTVLTARELAETLSLSVVTIFKLARRGIIATVCIGKTA